MKRLLVLLCVVLWPLCLSAMVEESDEALAEVTGQAGMNMNPNFTVDITIGTLAWGDKSGLDADAAGGWSQAGTAGYLGIVGLNLPGVTVNQQNGVSGVTYKPFTIDTATGGVHGSGVTFVRFGFGSLKLTMPGQDLTLAMGPSATNLNQVLGRAYINLTALEFDPRSYVDFYANASECGVNIAENIIIKDLQLKTLSWGDTDGIPGVSGSAAGYVGISNLQLTTTNNPITVSGILSYNIGSNSAYTNAGTVIRVGYYESDFTVNVPGPITGDVVLDSARTLDSSGAHSIGDFYVSASKTVFRRDGYVDMWGH